MDTNQVAYPPAASLYQLVRTHPGALQRLEPLGITRDHLAFSLQAAASALHVPIERLTVALRS